MTLPRSVAIVLAVWLVGGILQALIRGWRGRITARLGEAKAINPVQTLGQVLRCVAAMARALKSVSLIAAA